MDKLDLKRGGLPQFQRQDTSSLLYISASTHRLLTSYLTTRKAKVNSKSPAVPSRYSSQQWDSSLLDKLIDHCRRNTFRHPRVGYLEYLLESQNTSGKFWGASICMLLSCGLLECMTSLLIGWSSWSGIASSTTATSDRVLFLSHHNTKFISLHSTIFHSTDAGLQLFRKQVIPLATTFLCNDAFLSSLSPAS